MLQWFVNFLTKYLIKCSLMDHNDHMICIKWLCWKGPMSYLKKHTVSWNVMIIGYVQNGYVERACELFEKIPHLNVVSCIIMIKWLLWKEIWKWIIEMQSMIVGYAQSGFSKKALGTVYVYANIKSRAKTLKCFSSILP